MRIRSAVGLGIGIVVLKVLMATVFLAFEGTLLKFFSLSESIMDTAQNGLAGL